MIEIFEKWTMTYISIVLEALPFILLGSLVSAIIQLYISEEKVKRILPSNKFISFFIAAVSGLFLPICECAIVPIAKSLIKKGVPIGVGIVFMLSVPIVNPVVVMSTYYAFDGNINIVFIRVIGGIICALIIGFLLELLFKNKRDVIKDDEGATTYCDCGCIEGNYFYRKSKIRLCLEHTSKEFLEISRYYIFGAFLSSVFITFMNEKLLINLASDSYVGILIMMALSFLLSLCSEADAFIARGFLDAFGVGAVTSFLILGPMLDLKNVIILYSSFKKGFIHKFIIVTTAIIFIFSLLITLIA